MTSNVDQQAEGGGQNVYARRDVVIQGVTADEVMKICEYVGKANFPKLMKAARETVEERFQEFANKFFKALADKKPESIENFDDPGLQAALSDAVTGYARSGDGDLGDVLANILVERAQQTTRSTMQLSLDAAVTTAAKLTSEHYQALTFSLFVGRTKLSCFDVAPGLYEKLQWLLIPFGKDLNITDSDVQYLEALGCGSATHLSSMQPLSQLLLTNYPGVFMTGIAPEEPPKFPRLQQPTSAGVTPLIPCLRNPELLQVNAVDKAELEAITTSLDDEAEIEFLRAHFNTSARIGTVQISEELVAFDQRFEAVIRNWDAGKLRNFRPTVTGVAIGHANACRVLGAQFDAGLDKWID